MFIRQIFLILSKSILLLLLLQNSSCYVVRSIAWNVANLDDNKKFPADTILKPNFSWNFLESRKNKEKCMPGIIFHEKSPVSFETFLAERTTVAFLIIKKDTLIYEQYFQGYTKDSILPSFSIAKSFVSALVGIALEEGYIHSFDQPITDFIPELKDPGFKRVTFQNLLAMRSGIAFEEDYLNPTGDIARFYYGRNLLKFCLNLKVTDEPGNRYNYQSANTQLIAIALERATGVPLSEYFQEKIWKPIGAENNAIWNVDSKKNLELKAFCCMNASAVDFAKFGRLYLNEGSLDGIRIISKEWIQESLSIQNDSRDLDRYPYTYSWRVTAQGDFFAKGVGGQYIFVCPHKKIIIVRLGVKYADVPWPELFEKLCNEL